MDCKDNLSLNINFSEIKSYEDYKHIWQKLAPVEVKMIEKNEECRHDLANAFIYKNHYDKPKGICSALHHVLQLYIWRASLGFPSWENDPSIYRIHCPDKKGTVWKIQRKVK